MSKRVNNTEWLYSTGQQFRKSEQYRFHDYFLISQPNPMMWSSLKSSLRDDSNEWSHHGVWLRNKTVSILKTINVRPYLLPWFYLKVKLHTSSILTHQSFPLSTNIKHSHQSLAQCFTETSFQQKLKPNSRNYSSHTHQKDVWLNPSSLQPTFNSFLSGQQLKKS